ncbi:hypothetical protein VNO80_02325 [Phaseolus coccineus]|uniref:Uncharacterized protein n=1 Tax=Phaseolus coccineus TaxID=3886 RepID=A0AAN9NPS5_PHACN
MSPHDKSRRHAYATSAISNVSRHSSICEQYLDARLLGARVWGACVLYRARHSSICELGAGAWSVEEDRVLTGVVEVHGPRNWALISRHVKGRSGKSCRFRWCNQLSPRVEYPPFTTCENAVIRARSIRKQVGHHYENASGSDR